MIKAYFQSRPLAAQIRDAEQQILTRQRGVGIRADTLIKKTHQQMTAPSTLLLTVGIGFIIGELTKRQTSNNRSTADKQRTIGTSPLKTALNLLISVHTLYSALPIAWMIKSFHLQGTSGSSQTCEQQAQPEPTTSGVAGNRRRSRR